MEKVKNIAILCHELSGNGKGFEVAKKAHEYLNGKNILSQLFVNDWPEALDGFTEVWVGGGDGTIHQFINRYKNTNIPMAMLGGGTGNDLKNHLYKTVHQEQHFENLLTANYITIDLGYCNGKLYANSLGIGFDGDVLQNMKSIRMIGGHLGYLIGVIKSIFTFREKNFTLRFDGNEKKIKPVILAISNSRLTGGGFVIAPLSSLQDGLLDLMYTDPLPWWKRLIVLPKVEKGKHIDLPYVHHHHIKKVEIISNEPVFYQIDGELMSAQNFTIGIDDKKLLLNCKG